MLAEAEVFAPLSAEQRELIAGCGHVVRLEGGQELFEEGEQADTFYLLRHGRVALQLMMPGRGTITISTHGPGELVGWSWLFPPYRWHFDGRVVEGGSAIAFDGACLRGKAEGDHDLGYALMRGFATQMIERLQATRIQLLDLYGHPAPS